jgi:hypothetical protein
MSGNECKPLLETCGTNMYNHNSFRLLGVDVDQTSRRLKRCLKDLQSAIEVDELADEYSSALRPIPLPSYEELSQAEQRLQDTQLRFIHEFFWFWPLEWGKSDTDKILKILKSRDITIAQKSWEKLAKKGFGESPLVAKHNLAVSGHMLALDYEQKLLSAKNKTPLKQKQYEKINEYWNFAFKYWEQLCEDDAFWTLLENRALEKNDYRVTAEFVRSFRKTLPIAFDNINADLAVEFCYREMHARAKDHIHIMQQTNQGEDDVEASLQRVTSPLHARIDWAIEQSTLELTNNKTEGKARCLELFNTVKEILAVLETLLGTTNPEYTETCDRVAENMLKCQIAYGNETEDWEGSIPLLEASHKIACGEVIRNRIQKNLDTVQNNIKLGRCWFCQKNKPQSGSEIKQKMHKKIYWKDVKSGKYPKLMKQVIVQFGGMMLRNRLSDFSQLDAVLEGKVLASNTSTISIPRCPQCKKIHNTSYILFWVTALPIGVQLAIISALIWDGWKAFLIGAIGVCIGLACGAKISDSRTSSHKIEVYNHWRKHPAVKELLKDGWEEGDPPSN